jgi:hypothetical protein
MFRHFFTSREGSTPAAKSAWPGTRRSRRSRPGLEALEGRELMSLGAPFLVDSGMNASRGGPLVATSSNGTSVFVWNQAANVTGGNEILAQRSNTAGFKLGPEIIVSEGSITAGSVAMDAQGDFVVACTLGNPSVHTDVVALKFNASDRLVGDAQVAVGTFMQNEPVVAMDAGGDFVVAYNRFTNGYGRDVFAKRYDANCNLLSVIPVAVTSALEYSPNITMTPDGRFDIAYELSIGTYLPQDIIVNRYSATGSLLGTSQIGPFAFGTLQSGASIAMDNTGDAVITYTQRDPISYYTTDIEAQRIGPTGVFGADIQIYRAPTYASPTGIVLQPNGGSAGSFVVPYAVETLISPSHLFDGYVAVVNGSNELTWLYGIGATVPTINTDGPGGFVLTYASPYSDSASNDIYGQIGSYVTNLGGGGGGSTGTGSHLLVGTSSSSSTTSTLDPGGVLLAALLSPDPGTPSAPGLGGNNDVFGRLRLQS